MGILVQNFYKKQYVAKHRLHVLISNNGIHLFMSILTRAQSCLPGLMIAYGFGVYSDQHYGNSTVTGYSYIFNEVTIDPAQHLRIDRTASSRVCDGLLLTNTSFVML